MLFLWVSLSTSLFLKQEVGLWKRWKKCSLEAFWHSRILLYRSLKKGSDKISQAQEGSHSDVRATEEKQFQEGLVNIIVNFQGCCCSTESVRMVPSFSEAVYNGKNDIDEEEKEYDILWTETKANILLQTLFHERCRRW